MEHRHDVDLHRAIGMSDLSTLLAEAFRFPEGDRMANALADGSFMHDWVVSWQDVGVVAGGEMTGNIHAVLDDCEGIADAAADVVGAWRACGDSLESFRLACEAAFAGIDGALLRREYSRLFLTPGLEVPVWPYESAFLHREAGRTDTPDLFRTKTTVDVERQMADAGVRPEHVRTEPCDLCATELEFLSYLYARWGEAMRTAKCGESGRECEDGARAWVVRIAAFVELHALKWFPRFFEQVILESRIPAYRCFAEFGLAFTVELERDLCRFRP